MDERIYSVSMEISTFVEQLREEQSNDAIISSAMQKISDDLVISEGQLKRVSKQLRIENGILKKSGRPIVPPSLRQYVFETFHNENHFGFDKLYAKLKDRFYWPGMYQYIKNQLEACEICIRCKTGATSPKAPLIPIYEPQRPMEFISLDIGYMPVDLHPVK